MSLWQKLFAVHVVCGISYVACGVGYVLVAKVVLLVVQVMSCGKRCLLCMSCLWH